MAAFAEARGIAFPIAIDVDRRTIGAFAVDSYPDYYLIDRSGKLRVADLANADLERAVQVLLAERPALSPALAKASSAATKKDKRILVLWGSDGEREAIDGLLKTRELGTLVRNEYEVVRLERTANAELAQTLQAGFAGPAGPAGSAGAALAVLDARGFLLARMDGRGIEAEALGKFLEAQRVPVKDAEVLWSQALAQAQREKKNILVHLGAPW